MRSIKARRFRNRSSAAPENSFFKKETKQDRTFFGASSYETFFQPVTSIQRKCEKCEEDDKKVHRMTDQKEEGKKLQRQPDKKEEEKKLQRNESDSPVNTATNNYYSSISGGQNLPKDVNHFYASRMGHDFSDVKIHTGKEAATSAAGVNARAYTIGNHIIFNEGEYDPSTNEGKKILAHELTHIVQQKQNGNVKIQRAVKFNVQEWNAEALTPPALENKDDFIVFPPKKIILIEGLVQVNGDKDSDCADFEFGTTQTAWISWVRQYYHGQKSGEGSAVVQYNQETPMRDPSSGGNIWYTNNSVNSPASCGDSAGSFTNDAPWHNVPKTITNDAITGSPLNYLTGYSRGLHLVHYLTGKKKGGDFFKTPLKYRYWNMIQDFSFSPNYSKPADTWTNSGSFKVNIGGKGSGETPDAPYFTSSGTTANTHFNDGANWKTTEHK
jgi:hypothetical protein